MNTELKNAVKATDKDAQYDTSAKRLLGQKSILAPRLFEPTVRLAAARAQPYIRKFQYRS